jgi:hypothetical protein
MQEIALATDHLRVKLLGPADAAEGYAIDVRTGDNWRQVGIGRFGRLVYRTTDGQRRETTIRLARETSAPDRLDLAATWKDDDGVSWTFRHNLRLTDDPCQLLVSCRADPNAARKVLHWSGPTFLAGEGAFGARKSQAIFPGLEYLLDDEPSSGTAFASERHAARYVPHPYKLAIPMMAVAHDGLAVGLLWDANQDYGRAWRHPAAVFASPNRLEDASNHLLGLFAPGVGRFVEENALEAKEPFGIGPGSPLSLEARLVALTDASAIDVLKVWVETFGLPELPAPHGYAENVELCVRSYLDVAWDETAEAWHHTLADPWGPRFEHRVVAQLWRYGQWPKGDPTLRARAREQVRRGLARALAGQPGASMDAHRAALPHLELALHCGMLPESLTETRRLVGALTDGQDADGSWPWRPELIAAPQYDTEERRRALGGSDSSTGLTADRARHLLVWARITGDLAATEAGLRAVAWCNAQRRPEGAQTWELHLHVPDVLAAPYLVDVNLEALALTGEAGYLEQAERWAWTGLPFTYLWRAYYRPIMAYGTVPVFGVTFHDVQPWFGVDVHWNGLAYADALFRLAAASGEERWRKVALGIVHSGMQQQATAGPWLGMYPDAFSQVRGDEEYTWWLNPNLIGLNTFELAGLPLDVETTTLRQGGGEPVRITSGARVIEARLADGRLQLLLDYPPDEPSQTLIAGFGEPGRVRCEGRELPRVSDLDGASAGWTPLPDFGVVAVKAPHGAGGTASLDLGSR